MFTTGNYNKYATGTLRVKVVQVFLLCKRCILSSMYWMYFNTVNVHQQVAVTTREALLGGSMLPAPFAILPRPPCSLPFFWRSLLFSNFHCFFFNSLCSLLLFNFFSCSLLLFPTFCASCSQITFSLLLARFLILGHAPCSLGSHGPFSLLPDYP